MVHAQKVDWKKINSFKPDNIFMAGDRQPTEVLLLGTFHFGYPNLDGHKTDSSRYIDVKSSQRQKEMVELAEVIKRFRPTRIYIESSDQPWIDSLYNEYLQDRYNLGRNEIYQLAFRIGRELKQPKLFAVDTWPFSNQYSKQYKWIDSLWDDNNMVDSLRDKYWSAKFRSWYDQNDSIRVGLTLLESFLMMAEPTTLQRMHGHYLSAGFNTSTSSGPDALSIWWYNRNLRIFNKILSTKPTAEDRIVVLFGNGHMPILRHCFYSSPEFKIVELKSLLK
jgi:hypothetical protein